jgi:hypothetical protein
VTEEIVGVEPGEGLVIFGTAVMGVGVLGFSSEEALFFLTYQRLLHTIPILMPSGRLESHFD